MLLPLPPTAAGQDQWVRRLGPGCRFAHPLILVMSSTF